MSFLSIFVLQVKQLFGAHLKKKFQTITISQTELHIFAGLYLHFFGKFSKTKIMHITRLTIYETHEKIFLKFYFRN